MRGNDQHVYEVRPRKDKRGFDLISDVLPSARYKRPRIVLTARGSMIKMEIACLTRICTSS